jgi:hypothetical protein
MPNKALLRTTKLGSDGIVYYLEVHKYHYPKVTYVYKILPGFVKDTPAISSYGLMESGTLEQATEDYLAMQLGELKLDQFLRTL